MLQFRSSSKWGRVISVLALAYPLVLLVVLLVLWLPGYRFWQADLALYLPRAAFLAPLPLLVGLLIGFRLRALLWSQACAALIVAFPLMGLVLPVPSFRAEDSRSLRVLSYNVAAGYGRYEELVQQISENSPDLVLLQELAGPERIIPLLQSRYPTVQQDREFLLASRFPIHSTFVPGTLAEVEGDRSSAGGRSGPAGFAKYIVETSLGRFAVFNMHAASPRAQFYAVRGGGLRRAILSGSVFSLQPKPAVESISRLRSRQAEIIAAAAKRETVPVVLAGDTNLPSLSPPLRRFSDFQDGFREAGAGFGYTFPSHRPWMRIDRIFASKHLRFVDFEVGSSRASDHRWVAAELVKRKP